MCLTRFLAALALLVATALPAGAQILAGNNQPNFKNLVDNGNFNINQRGAVGVTAATITTAAKYLQDRWAAVSGTATSGALTNVTSSLPSQFTNAAQVQRTSGQTGVVKFCLLQEIPTADITALQGQPVTLSFWALSGANYSAANGALVAQFTTGTSTDEGLATWLTGLAGAASAIPTANATVTLTANWQRFAVTGTIAATATEGVVNICMTPVGTAGTNDYFQITGVQLEQGTVATNFEWVPYGIEIQKVLRYAWVVVEPAAGVFVANCNEVTTAYMTCVLPAPTTMFKAPTLSFSTQSTSTWEVFPGGSATAVTLSGATSLIQNAFGANTLNQIGLKVTGASTPFTAGYAGILAGAGAANSYILASSDF
jgi:hypothetical protein